MSRAERDTLKIASSCGTDSGCRLRASAVDMVATGTRTSGETPRCTASFLCCGPWPSTHAMVRPATSAGATLSGWPSISVARRRSASASISTVPARRPWAAMMPDTMAAARGSEAAAVRDPVLRDEVETRHGLVERGEGVRDGRDHEVRLVGRHLARAHAAHVDRGAGRVAHRDREVVVQREREAERVEAGAEVGARRGHAHLDAATRRERRAHRTVGHDATRSSTPALSAMSTPTLVGATSEPSAVRSAHCGSFRP